MLRGTHDASSRERLPTTVFDAHCWREMTEGQGRERCRRQTTVPSEIVKSRRHVLCSRDFCLYSVFHT
jgi:hypothetical protein